MLHLHQLVGLALGLEPNQLGVGKHIVRPSPVIDGSTAVVAASGGLHQCRLAGSADVPGAKFLASGTPAPGLEQPQPYLGDRRV